MRALRIGLSGSARIRTVMASSSDYILDLLKTGSASWLFSFPRSLAAVWPLLRLNTHTEEWAMLTIITILWYTQMKKPSNLIRCIQKLIQALSELIRASFEQNCHRTNTSSSSFIEFVTLHFSFVLDTQAWLQSITESDSINLLCFFNQTEFFWKKTFSHPVQHSLHNIWPPSKSPYLTWTFWIWAF